jgi:hypothetical protein
MRGERLAPGQVRTGERAPRSGARGRGLGDQYVKISVSQILRVSGLPEMRSAPEKSAYSIFPDQIGLDR